MGLRLEIITPEYVIYKGEVEIVTVPGKNGKFQMLKDHAPIVATLEKGKIIIKATKEPEVKHKSLEKEADRYFLNVSGGTIELNNNHLIILAD